MSTLMYAGIVCLASLVFDWVVTNGLMVVFNPTSVNPNVNPLTSGWEHPLRCSAQDTRCMHIISHPGKNIMSSEHHMLTS